MAEYKEFFETGRFSDLIIQCGVVKFSVHKVIVCAHSNVLLAACSSGFEESTSNIINLPDDEPSIVEKMISFMYSGEYLVSEEDEELRFMIHKKVYAMADKYNVEKLPDLAISYFTKIVENAVAAIREYNAVIGLPELLRCIPEIYTSTPRNNRGFCFVALHFTRRCALRFAEYPGTWTIFEEVLDIVPSFARDLLMDYIDTPTKITCPECSGPGDIGCECKVLKLMCLNCDWETENMDPF